VSFRFLLFCFSSFLIFFRFWRFFAFLASWLAEIRHQLGLVNIRVRYRNRNTVLLQTDHGILHRQNRSLEATPAIQRQIQFDLRFLTDKPRELFRCVQRAIEPRRGNFQRVATLHRIVHVEDCRYLTANRLAIFHRYCAFRRIDVHPHQTVAVRRAVLDPEAFQPQITGVNNSVNSSLRISTTKPASSQLALAHGGANAASPRACGGKCSAARPRSFACEPRQDARFRTKKKRAQGPFHSQPLSCIQTPAIRASMHPTNNSKNLSFCHCVNGQSPSRRRILHRKSRQVR